jgi:predicted ATPase
VAAYLDARFPAGEPGRAAHQQLAAFLRQQTDGHPFFLVNLVNDLLERGILHHSAQGWTAPDVAAYAPTIPISVRQLLARQMERLPAADHQVLAAASVAGAEFSAAAVAAALEDEIARVEGRCEELARRQAFLRRAGIEEWPDGTVAARYGFQHALCQQLWHEQVTISLQQRWHHRIGLRKEAAYTGRVQEIAAELAVHFAQARDYPRAIQYHEQAAVNARHRHAYPEAIQHLTSGLSLLSSLSDSPVRDQQELSLRMALGASAIATQGFAAPEVEIIFDRARTLCETLKKTTLLPSTLQGLWVFHFVRGELRTALAWGETLLQLAQHEHDAAALVQAHISLGAPFLFLGDLEHASQHMGQGITLYTLQHQQLSTQAYELDPGVFCRSYGGFARLCLGSIDQGEALCEEAVQLATTIKHPHSLALALTWATLARYFRGEYAAARAHAETLLALAREHAFPYWLGFGQITHGWTLGLVERWQEAREEIGQGLAALRQTGTGLAIRSGIMLLADVYRKEGQGEAGRQLLAEFLDAGDEHAEQLWDVELHRLRGELTLQREAKGWRLETSPPSSQASRLTPQVSRAVRREAEECFLKAIDLARQQQAKALELRATLSLARLWQCQGKHHKARNTLSEIYNWFTEGFDTKDLQEAKVLLEELDRRTL